jgi:hypothetical protein
VLFLASVAPQEIVVTSLIMFNKSGRLFSVDFSDESQDVGVKSATFAFKKYCIIKILDGGVTTEHHLVSKFE